MNQKGPYYAVKFISVIIFLTSCMLLLGSVAVLRTVVPVLAQGGQPEVAKRLLETMLLFISDSFMAIIGSIALFFFRKFGFYLVAVAIIFFWIIGFTENQMFAAAGWPTAAISAIFFIFLIYKRKYILGYRAEGKNGK